MSKMTNAMKKDLAESMYINDGLSPEKIMEKLGVAKSTIYRWIKNEKEEGALSWDEQRSLLQSSAHKIKQFIDKKLVEAIETGKYDPKFSDFIIKAVKARESLNKHVTAQAAISVFMEFDQFMAEQDLEMAKKFIKYHKMFIYHKAAQQ